MYARSEDWCRLNLSSVPERLLRDRILFAIFSMTSSAMQVPSVRQKLESFGFGTRKRGSKCKGQ